MLQINTVTVIGANGTMGSNISGIFASFGGAKVYMVSRDIKSSEVAKVKASKSVKAGSVISRLIATDYSTVEKCISESDLIFEAVFEDLELKEKVSRMIATSMKEDAIACSGTSGLSITTLAEQYPEKLRSRFFGVHMFNPPYSLNLCELTSTKYSDLSLLNELSEYLSKVLYRTVVRVKDRPAFLGNRIGFQFINEALQYAEKYKYSGGIDYIDAILGSFSGRSMPPLVTADFVGLDIHKAIATNIYENTVDYAHDTFIIPEFVDKLIIDNHLGKKSGAGLYKTVLNDDGSKHKMVYDICSDTYRDIMDYHFPYAEQMIEQFHVGNYKEAFKALINNHSTEAEICLDFLLKYVLYSIVATNLVGYNIHSADSVMAEGFNWCPPLAVVDAINSVVDFKQLATSRLDKATQEKIDIEKILESIEPSQYDFRPFFKAKK